VAAHRSSWDIGLSGPRFQLSEPVCWVAAWKRSEFGSLPSIRLKAESA